MSDFSYDVEDDRTEADDRLDRILASTDAELSEAIRASQTRRCPSYPPDAAENVRLRTDTLPRQKDRTYDSEGNPAVERALDALERLQFVMSSMDAADPGVAARIALEVGALSALLRSRSASKKDALVVLSSVQAALSNVGAEPLAFRSALTAWQEAFEAVLVLFEHSGDHEGYSVPAPH